MATFTIRLQDHGVGEMLRFLTIRHLPVVQRALNRVAFDVRDAEVVMTAKSFDFWSSTTKTFMANPRSFPFELATKSKLEAKVFAGTASMSPRSGKLRDIFARQEFGFTLRPSERLRLVLGSSPAQYAVPTKDPSAHLRTARARVLKTQTPAALLGIKGGGFARFKPRRRRKKGVGALGTHVFLTPNDRAIVEVTPSGGRRLLYGLYSKDVKVDEHLEFFDTAVRVVGKNIIPKLLAEWDRSMGRFGA